MGGDTATATAVRLSEQRATLVGLLEELPETRLSKPTARLGWTLRHELAWVAASDEELLQRLALAAGAATEEPHWRRVRGEAMHAAQELRLAALHDHLEATGAKVATSLGEHADRLDEPAIRAALESHLGHSDAAIAAVRAVLAK